jgi:hypothetical protein
MEYFEIGIDQDEEEYLFTVFDDAGDAIIEVSTDDFGDGLRHVLFEVEPILAASTFPSDHLEWTESHKVDEPTDEEPKQKKGRKGKYG